MKLMILDGNSIANRAYYGIRTLTTGDGRPTNAVFGFLNILLSLENNYKPDAVAAAFDVHAPTFRHKLYDKYKGNRKGMDDELRVQMPEIKDILKSMGIKIIEKEGWEADDILGTLAKSCKSGDCCYIATGDRDSLQLVDDKVTVLLASPKAGQTQTVEYTPEYVTETKGVKPHQLIDVKALMGDASDNIPGVPGIGEKTATSLIQKFGTLDNVYSNIDSEEIKNSVRTKLSAGKDSAYISKTLGTIRTDVPIETDYRSYVPKEIDKQELKKLLADLEMTSFIEKLGLKDVVIVNTDRTNAKISLSNEPAENLLSDEDEIFLCFDEKFERCAVCCSGKAGEYSMDEIKPLLANEKLKKCVDDSKSLYKNQIENGYEIKNISFDSTLAGYLLNANSSDYSVETLADTYKVFVDIETDDKLIRNAALLSQLKDKLLSFLDEYGETSLLYDVEIPLAEVLSSMENIGFKIDRVSIAEFGIELNDRISVLTREIYDYAGHEFKINSPKQLAAVLFEELKLPPKKKTKSGFSTNVEVLESLRDDHPIIDLVLEYRSLTKLKSTYCDGLLKAVKEDGRVHSTFKQTETRTGRLSSTEPNLQNIPVRTELGAEMRKFFTADSGKTLVDADYSQIELRVLSCVADDANMQNAFNNGVDIHALTASQVFGIPIEMVSSKMRSRAKAVNFGIVYGIGAYSLSKDINVSVSEARRYIDNYLKTFSGIDRYMKEIVKKAKEDGFVTTLFGRRRYIPELKSSNAVQRAFGERVARNAPIQGTAADIIKIAMINVYNTLKKEVPEAKLIMQVHDELIVECPDDKKDEVAKILKSEMENAVSLKVKLTADVQTGKTWYEAKG